MIDMNELILGPRGARAIPSSEVRMWKLSAICLSIAACQATLPHIVNGENAKAHSYPWILTLVRNDVPLRFQKQNQCGASLIRVPYLNGSSDVAVTAAHCIGSPKQPCCDPVFQRFSIIASNHNIQKHDKGETKRRVVTGRCHMHWDWRNAMRNDIALLKLDQPIQFSDTIQPIALPKQGEKVKVGTICTVAGWGGTAYNKNQRSQLILPTVLQELQVEILNNYECGRLPPTMLCEQAVKSGSHVYSGDSGSGVFCEKNGSAILQGIVSHTSGREPNLLGLHTRVSAYVNWIQEQLQCFKV